MELVSVIIPVYNIQKIKKVFKKAISSVQKQSYKEVEIICVNDGSTDNTECILERLSKKDNRILVLTKENGGVESARRMGIDNSNGKYIIHMDQDDYMNNNAIECFVKSIKKYDADIIVANSKRFIFSPHFLFGEKLIRSVEVMNRDEFMNKYFRGFFGKNLFPINIWNKIYKKSFLDSIDNPPLTGFYNEDLSYNMHVMSQANKIVFVEDILYYYRWGGFTNRKIENLLEVSLSCYNLKIEKIREINNDDDFIIGTSIELLNYINTYFYQMIEFEKYYSDRFQNEVKKTLELKEVKEAIDVIRKYDKYHNDHVDLMLKNDIFSIEKYEREIYKNNWKKRCVKNTLMNIINLLNH